MMRVKELARDPMMLDERHLARHFQQVCSSLVPKCLTIC
jgi:hypothetical protein